MFFNFSLESTKEKKIKFFLQICHFSMSEGRKLPRPNLYVNPSKWSAAQTGGIASRVAIVGTVVAVIGGISLVFLYPYLNIDQFRKSSEFHFFFFDNELKSNRFRWSVLGKIQKYNRAEINQEDVQPTGQRNFSPKTKTKRFFFHLGLPVWRDPFGRKKTD